MNKLLAVVRIFIYVSLAVIIVIYENPFNILGKPTTNIIRSDPLPSVISSIQHRGKLVVSDIDIRTETVSHIDSSVWDASVSSFATARLQVYMDLALVTGEWVKRNENTITIVIPKKAIKTEIIATGEEHHSNESWRFTFYPGDLSKAKATNHDTLVRQLQKEANTASIEEQPLVALQLGRLFQTALAGQGYKVEAKIEK